VNDYTSLMSQLPYRTSQNVRKEKTEFKSYSFAMCNHGWICI